MPLLARYLCAPSACTLVNRTLPNSACHMSWSLRRYTTVCTAMYAHDSANSCVVPNHEVGRGVGRQHAHLGVYDPDSTLLRTSLALPIRGAYCHSLDAQSRVCGPFLGKRSSNLPIITLRLGMLHVMAQWCAGVPAFSDSCAAGCVMSMGISRDRGIFNIARCSIPTLSLCYRVKVLHARNIE